MPDVSDAFQGLPPPWARDLLACPRCGSALGRTRAALRCVANGHEFPVRGGIARFAEDPSRDVDASVARTSESFGLEFTALDPATPTARKMREDALTFLRATGIDPGVYAHVSNAAKRRDLTVEDIGYDPDWSAVRGRLVLDAGCGAGRFTRLMAEHGARVVGLDLSDAVERAAAACAGLESVAIVQGDVLSPPLRAGVFDQVFSIGVLHHTRDTRLGLRALAALVKPGGDLSVWVYDPGYWAGPVRGTITKGLRKVLLRLPVAARAAFCRRVLLPIGRLQLRLARRRLTKVAFAPLFALNIPRHEDRDVMLSTIFDYWMAPVIRTHRSEELYDWFAELGFDDIRILPTPTAVRARRPLGAAP